MRRIFRQALVLPLLVVTFFLLVANSPRLSAQVNAAYVSYNDFYEDLSNYGQWIDDPQYGYVWSPNVDGSFRPYYTNGYWAMTEYGNTWVSNYPWGWACFHYGRWIYDTYYGWLWIPGQDWGPAWVSWRYGDGFYGWAPLGPGYDFAGDYYCPDDWWVFIPPQYLYSGNYYHYWYGPRGNGHVLPNTTFVNNTYVSNGITYINGPRTSEVEGITHQPVQVFHLANSKSLNSRVHDNTVKLFHPMQIKPVAAEGGTRTAPPNVVSAPQPVRNAPNVRSEEDPQQVPAFKTTQPKNNGRVDQPGANINQTAQPEPRQPRNDNNPYEYDVNRPVQQPQPAPRPEVTPQPAPAPRPQPQPQQRYQPQPQYRPQPAPRPAPQPQRTPAPAPRPQGGGRR